MMNARLLPIALICALAACAVNPATGHREFSLMSEAQEIQLGKEMDVQVRREMGVYEDAALQRYVQEIGSRLASASERPALPWQFTVVDSAAVNAFALPGGYIYVTRGILPFLDNEAQLAGVLGHEIGHVTARHAAQQYTKTTSAGIGLALLGVFVPEAGPLQGVAESALGVLFLKYGRDDELQADRLGVQYAARTGWDPSGVAGMLNTLSRLDEASGNRKGVPNWLSTHPAPADRVTEIEPFIQKARTLLEGEPIVGKQEYLTRVDGIIFGDSPSEGILRGNQFLHPPLRFGVTFPQGWEVLNTRTQVVSKAPDQDQYLLLQIVQNSRGSVEQVAQNEMAAAGFRQIDGQRTSINGLDAYVGTYQGTAEGVGSVVTLTAHIAHQDRVFRLAGLAPANAFESAQREFTAAIRSFRPMSASEAEQIRPNRVDIYLVRQGDRWEEIAQRTGGILKPTTLAIMNGYEPSQPPKPGDRIKIVVSG
jgi:predicted Zn-dependent protease